MMTKILLIFVGTAFLVSCNPKSAIENSDQNIKKDSLEQISETNIDEQTQTQGGEYAGIALEKLNIRPEDCYSEFITEKVLPYDTGKAVVVIPKISHKEDIDSFVMDAYIVVVDHNTHEILYKFYQSEAWTSDAMHSLKVEIDTALYTLNSSTQAFGIRTSYYIRALHYSETLISLFIPKGKELVKVLEDFPISIYQSELDMGCERDESFQETVLVVAERQTNGYNDIIANSTIKTITYTNLNKEDINDCEEESSTKYDTQTIRFQGGKYRFEKKEF